MSSNYYIIGPTESLLTKRGNRFPNFAEYLVNEGLSIQYYTSNFYHAEKRFFSDDEIRKAKDVANYNFFVIPVLGYYSNISPRRVISNFIFSLFLFWNLLWSVKRGDVILLPSRPVESIYFIALLKRIRKVEIYLDIQDIWPDMLNINSKIKKKIFEAYCNLFLRRSLKYYNGTIHTAPSFVDWLNRYSQNIPSTFVPLGWEKGRWPKNIPTSSKTVVEGSLKLVCVAQLQHQIDIMPILNVLAKRPKVSLTIVGEDGKGERYKEVKSFINERELKNVEIVGRIPRADVSKYLIDKDIGILPMITSSVPNKIFDYLGAFLPIIVMGKNDSEEFVVDNGIGWSCDFDSDELLDLLDGISDDEISNKKVQVASVRDKYSRESLHKTMKEIIGTCSN